MKDFSNDQRTVFADRYAAAGETQPEQMWERVANAIGNDERQKSLFAGILDGFKFVPGGRILASAGVDAETTAYNCYVIPVEARTSDAGNDSRESIFDTINRMVQIMSRGGGVGINWSTLRPRGSHLLRVNGTSSGAVGWMDVASHAVGEVIQGGSRRGAAMFMLWDWHPDIELFIDAKRDRTKITNANVSVAISDDFMAAVEHDHDWRLKFPDTNHPAYNTDWDGDIKAWANKHGSGAVITYKTIKARDLWNKICEAAWDNGEPGVVFLERAQKMSTAGELEKIISVNPCGEQPLGAYSVCNLGSMNLAAYVDVDGEFHWERFENDVETAIEFLDCVIDKSYYIEDMPETRKRQEQLRRVGLGIMGLADALAMMGIRYGSPNAVEFTSNVFSAMKQHALRRSVDLARRLGPAKGWKFAMALDAPYLEDVQEDVYDDICQYGLRNLFLLTQAPTGTTSLLAGVNGGIEPFFALEYERNDRLGKRMIRPKPYQEWLDENGNNISDLTLNGKGLPAYFVTANEVTVEEHIAMQAAAQKYVDSSISKTVNAPNSHTVEDVDKLYRLAYNSGLKGIAYFREGCNRDVVLSRVKEPEVGTVDTMASPYVRPVNIHGTTTRVSTRHGNAFITINSAEGNGPIETFVNVGRSGSELAEWSESLGRLISLALRHGVSVNDVADQLDGVGGYGKFAPSLASAVARTLRVADTGVTVEQEKEAVPTNPVSAMCPDCKNFSFVREEGCMKCHICGNSQC